MRIKPTVASVVGQSSDFHWGQVLQLPQAYGVVEVVAEDGVARGRGVAVLTKLARSLAEPPTSLDKLVQLVDAHLTSDIRTLALLVPVGQVLYIALRGRGRVYLKRANQLAVLIDGQGEVSGEIQLGDTLLLASAGFVEALTPEDLGTVFDHLSAQEVAEKLTLALHAHEDGEGGAAIIFQVSHLLPREEETPEVTSLAQPRGDGGKPARRTFKRFWEVRASVWGARRGRLLAVALIFGLMFVVSVILGIRRQTGVAQGDKLTTARTQAQHAFEEGVALLDLNPVKGRERLLSAKTTLEEALPLVSPGSADGRELADFYRQVSERLNQAMQVVRGEPVLFFDLSLIKKGAEASAISLFEDQLGALDSSGRTIYRLSLTTKSGQVIAGGEALAEASHVAIYGDRLYVLTPQGIHLVRLTDNKLASSVVPSSSDWGKITSLVAYGGNLYLLDSQKSRIWKYVVTEKGFSEIKEYLNPDTLPDFSGALGMSIDGSVWVGTNTGQILRFTQGRQNSWSPQGVEPILGQTLAVFTSDNSQNIYVLDGDNRRVVVLDKDGLYLAQYLWEGSFRPSQLVVSEKLKEILFLASGKIYSLELK